MDEEHLVHLATLSYAFKYALKNNPDKCVKETSGIAMNLYNSFLKMPNYRTAFENFMENTSPQMIQQPPADFTAKRVDSDTPNLLSAPSKNILSDLMESNAWEQVVEDKAYDWNEPATYCSAICCSLPAISTFKTRRKNVYTLPKTPQRKRKTCS